MSARRWTPRRLAGCLAFLLALTLLAGPSAEARRGSDIRQLIRLQVATFDPLIDGQPRVSPQSLGADTSGPYYIVQFKGPIEAIWAEQIERLGAQLLGYIPDNAHVARIQPADLPKIRQMYAVRWVGPY